MKKANSKNPKRKERKYVPSKKHNPAELNRRIEFLNEKIEKNNSINAMKEHAWNYYISLMTNFASHDIKNAVHNLDGYISTMNVGKVEENDIQSIKEIINGIRKTIEDFTSLASDQTKNEFQLFDLCNFVEILNRGQLNNKQVKFTINYDKTNQTIIKQSLHNLIQTLNNLIINSIKALESTKEKFITIDANINEDFLEILVRDNGCGISKNCREKIFDIHYSTTGGSGIGLAHAKYIFDNIPHASIILVESNERLTIFKIKLPIE
jgi:signal transduction histidine kinase